jgi:integrase
MMLRQVFASIVPAVMVDTSAKPQVLTQYSHVFGHACVSSADHEHLFFTDKRAPIPDVKYSYVRWQRTLRRLGIRYRKPYMARHTSVSWKLMIGRNPLLVAKDHGHRLTTMLSVYAAWAEGAVEADIAAIRDAMNRTDGIRRKRS